MLRAGGQSRADDHIRIESATGQKISLPMFSAPRARFAGEPVLVPETTLLSAEYGKWNWIDEPGKPLMFLIRKPFGKHELLARIRAVLRRAQSRGRPSRHFALHDLVVYPLELRAERGGASIDLSPRERISFPCSTSGPGKSSTVIRSSIAAGGSTTSRNRAPSTSTSPNYGNASSRTPPLPPSSRRSAASVTGIERARHPHRELAAPERTDRRGRRASLV